MVAKPKPKLRVPACRDEECIRKGIAQEGKTEHTIYARPMVAEAFHEATGLSGAYGVGMPTLLTRLMNLRRRILKDPKLRAIAEEEGLRHISL